MAESYERYGSLRVVRRGANTLIRSRYTLGALRSIWLAAGVLVVGCCFILRGLLRGNWARHDLTVDVLFFSAYAIAVLLWGVTYFYRRDELLIEGDDWLFSSWVPFRSTAKRGFRREEVTGLAIDQAGNLFGLRLDLLDGNLLLYSDGDLSIVRGAAEFLKPVINLPITERLGPSPSS